MREPMFRSLWTAAVISYTGTWMQNVGAGWLMTQLTMSPLMVGLVQAAMMMPVFLVMLPAGALADLVDRRRLLLVTQAGWWWHGRVRRVHAQPDVATSARGPCWALTCPAGSGLRL